MSTDIEMTVTDIKIVGWNGGYGDDKLIITLNSKWVMQAFYHS